MRYAIRTIWFERKRYFPGIVAVAFSGVLIALQAGILLGLIGVVSVPIVNSSAEIWVCYPETPACDLARPIPSYFRDRVWQQKGIKQVNEYLQGFTFWTTESGKNELVIVMGVDVNSDSIGPIAQLTPQQRADLTEPGAVILDRKDAHRVEVDKLGQTGECLGRQVVVRGFCDNMGSISGPYVLCSLQTAHMILPIRGDQTTYILATVNDPTQLPEIVKNLNEYPKFSAYTAEEFSFRSKWYWITKTKAGIAVFFTALLGLAVGASVTSQTLFSATVASLRELAVLLALGIPRWRMSLFVLQQAFVVGCGGLLVGFPITIGLALLARNLGTKAVLPPWLVIGTAVTTLLMAVVSGLFALRSLRQAEPASLLR